MTEGPYPALWGAGRKRGWACSQIPGRTGSGVGGATEGLGQGKAVCCQGNGARVWRGKVGLGMHWACIPLLEGTIILHILDEGREGLGGERRRVWRGKEGLK